MSISHLFNLAKTLLREKKLFLKSKWAKAFRYPIQSLCSREPWAVRTAHDPSWQTHWAWWSPELPPWTDAEQCCQGTCLTPLEVCQGRDAPESMLCTTTHIWCTQEPVWGKGCQVRQGKGFRTMQASCPGFKTFNMVLQWKTVCDCWHIAILWR